MTKLKMLFEPIKVGQVELKNRIICLAMGAGMKICDAEISPQLINFYAARVSGGASSVFLPLVAMYPGTEFNEMMPGAYEDKFIPGMRAMVKAIHAQGAKAGAQMFMLDDQYARRRGAPTEVVGPSAIPKPRGPIPRPLPPEEIDCVIESYAESAKRARDAGFDIVEFHFGIGFLVAKFISPLTNNRTDEYGGSLEKRMKLALDIIAAVKRKVGNDYTLSVRFSGDELIEGGHTVKEGREVAKLFEKADVHILNVQPGWTESSVPMVQMSVPRGHWLYLPEAVKEVVKIPVVAAPDKAKEGHFEDICTCVACCYCMDRPHSDMRHVLNNLPVLCSVNAQVGREGIYTIEAASELKRIAVVGGGPAGMEVARVAALRGHQVTLYEKDNKLGGLLHIATIPPYKEELLNLINYLSRQVEKNGVRIKLGEEFTEDTLERDKPEVVIVATGSVPLGLDIPGVGNSNVVGFMEVLTGAAEPGDRIVIVGGGMVGCEVAEFLHAKGKQVTILEMLARVGNDIGVTDRFATMIRLREAGIRMKANTKVVKITEEGVEATRDGATEFFEGDTVVLATGMKANNKLAKKLEHKVATLYSIGDCVEPHRITEAIENGFRIATQI